MFPIADVRGEFPSLHTGDDFIFFDNAAGAQVPGPVIDAVRDHLLLRNVQRGGRYQRSIDVDEGIERARERVAVFVNAFAREEIAFGLNATSFIRAISLGVAQTLGDRDEIIVTDLDHEANIAAWLALEPFGARIRWWHAREDARLYADDLDALLTPKTRLVACALASNAIGSLVGVSEVSGRAHASGAEVFVDAVHYGPHAPIDVQGFGCDYLVCSGYKIFGPHMGFLWGRRAALARLPTFKEEFIPDVPPAKLEAGTYAYENVAGMGAAVEYLERLGRRVTGTPDLAPRAAIVAAMEAIRRYEIGLSQALLNLPTEVRGLRVHGLRDPDQAPLRTPTLCFTLDGLAPAEITRRLAATGIGVRDGHMYAPRLMRRLGISPDTGAVRASLVHYNTLDEIAAFGEALRAMAP